MENKRFRNKILNQIPNTLNKTEKNHIIEKENIINNNKSNKKIINKFTIRKKINDNNILIKKNSLNSLFKPSSTTNIFETKKFIPQKMKDEKSLINNTINENDEMFSNKTSASNTPLKDDDNLLKKEKNIINENKKNLFDSFNELKKKKIIKKPKNLSRTIIKSESNPVKARFYNPNHSGIDFFINHNIKIKLNELKNNELIITEDLLIFESKFKLLQKYINEEKKRLINKMCFELWNYYFNCSLHGNLSQFFIEQKIKRIIEDSNTLTLVSILLIYVLTLQHDYFNLSVDKIKSLSSYIYKNYMLIWEKFILNIQIEHYNDNWIIKPNSISNEMIKENQIYINQIDRNVDKIYENISLILLSFKNNPKIINPNLIEIFNNYSKYTHNNIYQISLSKILRIKIKNSSLIYSEEKNKYPTINFIKTSPMKPLTLVLDLDETIISFTFTDEKEGIARIRPYLFQFLNSIKNYYEIIIFTAATQDYADPILDSIEENKEKYFSYRLYRENCTIIDNQYTKDISSLGRDISKIIIIDNLAQNFILNKKNGILISSFWGDDGSDKCLLYLGRILTKIGIEMMENNYLLDIRDELIKYKDEILNNVTFK